MAPAQEKSNSPHVYKNTSDVNSQATNEAGMDGKAVDLV